MEHNHELRPVLGWTFDLEVGAITLKVNAERSWVRPAGPVAR